METRKQKEIEYYDKSARATDGGDFEGFTPTALNSFRFLYELVAPLIKGKNVLDYGCGNGIHTGFLAEHAAKVTAIDLSEKSLETARKRFNTQDGLRIKFLKMDAEKMDFPDGSFDVVFDGGTFSSLDIAKAIPEIARVLKLSGVLVGIETFGHNPILNLKRKLNVLRGTRPEWAATHILRQEDVKLMSRYFQNVKLYYFHIVSWAAFPFLRFPSGKLLLKLLEAIDTALVKIPFMRKYAFKVVFIVSK